MLKRWVVRRDAGLYGYERALQRAGLSPVAGADEAGRGACAGPLVAGAVVLDPSNPIEGLRDSKLMSARQRESCYERIIADAVAWAVGIVTVGECDELGMHAANLTALRRAVWRLECEPAYVLTDGFSVDGLGAPGLAMWKGDRVAACVAASSIVAKVTRDAMMDELDAQYPGYDLGVHKGYVTRLHQQRLEELGPSPVHRMRYANVARVDRVDAK